MHWILAVLAYRLDASSILAVLTQVHYAHHDDHMRCLQQVPAAGSSTTMQEQNEDETLCDECVLCMRV